MHLRMERPTVAGSAGLACAVALCCAIGCISPHDHHVTIEWQLAPKLPREGTATVARIRLRAADNQQLHGARLQLEAHMSHPGMPAVVAVFAERDRGVYETQVTFTMAGNWDLVVSGTLADGQHLMRPVGPARVRRVGD